jgi:hypothetical protein
MKVYDAKGSLVVSYSPHAGEHEAGGSDQVSLGALSGGITDAQHGSRTVANAHAHSHLSGIGVNDHHARDHAATHLVGGADALSVGAPVDIGTSNAEGSATNFARRDHVHAHPGGLGENLHHNRSHDHSLAADGSPIAVAGVPNLPASKITSERFPMARMPDGASGQAIVGQGSGNDPAYAYVTRAQAGGRNIWVQASQPTALATGDIWIQT